MRSFDVGVHKPSSGLRVLSGQVSPTIPSSPLPSQRHFPVLPSPRSTPSTPTLDSAQNVGEAPPKALPWIWSCHKCHTRYPLGVTRRCLRDGHLFCGGATVNRVTGKIRRHKACASEFDYIGWEDFGAWKRTTALRKSAAVSLKNCEHLCDFPSSCHWNARHTPQKNADFGFLDPKCLGTESNIPPAPEKSTSKKTGGYISKMVKAAEKRTSQLTTLLSTIDEEKNFTSTPGYVPSPSEMAPKLPELSSVNGLDLSFPVMCFASSQDHLDDHRSPSTEIEPDLTSSESPLPELSSSVSSTDDEDVDMTDWLSEDAIYSPPLSSTSAPFVDFNFSIDQNQSPPASVESTSPLSPGFNAWDLTVSDIGIALGSPTKPAYE